MSWKSDSSTSTSDISSSNLPFHIRKFSMLNPNTKPSRTDLLLQQGEDVLPVLLLQVLLGVDLPQRRLIGVSLHERPATQPVSPLCVSHASACLTPLPPLAELADVLPASSRRGVSRNTRRGFPPVKESG
ncbi:hypothetical protein EYF80_058421 [Liparis tanakae]|uniref:Uncharacterized protein n=1 Tax=Liparis tanakae TaxID=230148 RepID=A0A4Z2ER80_9TELE|nr:hypothetical protein EYF80_058421 [Liparis tanakae]